MFKCLQITCAKYYMYKLIGICLKIVPCQSWRVCFIQRQNSPYFRCPASGERRKVDKKKQTRMKTETNRLYSRVFLIFLPNRRISSKSILIISCYTVYRFLCVGSQSAPYTIDIPVQSSSVHYSSCSELFAGSQLFGQGLRGCILYRPMLVIV